MLRVLSSSGDWVLRCTKPHLLGQRIGPVKLNHIQRPFGTCMACGTPDSSQTLAYKQL